LTVRQRPKQQTGVGRRPHREDMTAVRWVKPKIVVEVSFVSGREMGYYGQSSLASATTSHRERFGVRNLEGHPKLTALL
jgi:hypothetical protein